MKPHVQFSLNCLPHEAEALLSVKKKEKVPHLHPHFFFRKIALPFYDKDGRSSQEYRVQRSKVLGTSWANVDEDLWRKGRCPGMWTILRAHRLVITDENQIISHGWSAVLVWTRAVDQHRVAGWSALSISLLLIIIRAYKAEQLGEI